MLIMSQILGMMVGGIYEKQKLVYSKNVSDKVMVDTLTLLLPNKYYLKNYSYFHVS